MKTRTALSFITLSAAAMLAVASGPHTGGSYTVQPAVLDGGGARAVAASYTNDGSLTDIAGSSTAGVFTAGHGYIAQLVTAVGQCPAFTAWQTVHFGSPSHPNAAPAADPDHDGTDNVAEFAFNMNPNAPDSAPLPPGGTAGLPRYAIETVDGRLRLTVEFIRRPGCPEYILQGSGDLQEWSDTATIPAGPLVPLPGGFERVKLAEQALFSESPRHFLRILVRM